MNFLGYIKRYKINSIFVKNFIISFIVFLLPMLTASIFLFQNYVEKTERETKEIAYIEATNVRDYLDRMLRWIDINVNYMPNENYVNMFLFSGHENKSFQEITLMTNVLKSLIDKFKIVEPVIQSVYLYSFRSEYIFSTEGSGYLNEFSDTTIKDTIHLFQNSSELPGFYEYYDKNSVKLLRIYKGINISGQYAGLICVNIDCDYLNYTISEKLKNNHHIEIISDQNAIFFSVNEISEKYLFQELVSEYNGYKYLSYYPKTNFNFLWLVLCLVLISIIISIIAALFITFKTCMPIGNLIEIMEKPEVWVVAKEKCNLLGELKLVLENYINNIYYSREVEEKLSERVEELKGIQLDALGMQINPHFLFNTLQIISLSATKLTESKNEAVIATELLSKILKYNLYSKENTEIVTNEIAYVKAYVELQNIRYRGKIKVDFEVDENTLDKITTKLIIQPLVENAYAHGILPNSKSGTIKIKVYLKDNYLYIEVINDGVAMTSKKIEEIYEKMYSSNLKSEQSIGIRNVNRRIQLLFGNEYGVKIDEKFISGARFVIIQPIK